MVRFSNTVDIFKILASIMHAVHDHPSIIRHLRVHLPRPRTFRAILDSAYLLPGAHPPLYIDPDVLSLATPITAEAKHTRPWFYWNSLEGNCHVYKQCKRRGCVRRRRKVCSDCQSTGYCGKECQRKSVRFLYFSFREY